MVDSKHVAVHQEGQPAVRAVPMVTCNVHAPSDTSGFAEEYVVEEPLRAAHVNGTGRDPDAVRTSTSFRAEGAYPVWSTVPPSQRPLEVGCKRAADLLDTILFERAECGEERASNCTVARSLGVDEKQIRQWRDNIKRIPLGMIYGVPDWLREELLPRLTTDARKLPHARAAMARVRGGTDDLERAYSTIGESERAEMDRAVVRTIEQLQRLVKR